MDELKTERTGGHKRATRHLPIFALAAVTLAAGCGGSAPSGFFNMSSLEADLRGQLREKGATREITITKIKCVKIDKQTAVCAAAQSSGEHVLVEAIIASDGKSYTLRRSSES